MRCTTVLALLGTAAITPVLAAGAAGDTGADGRPHPAAYDLALRWNPLTRILSGTESIRVVNDGPGSLPRVWLRLWPNAPETGAARRATCDHTRAVLTVVAGAVVERRTVGCSAVELRLAQPPAPGGATAISVRFRLHVPRGNESLGRSAGVDLFGYAVPTLAVRDDRGWHLNPASSYGDPTLGLAAAWHASLQVPADLDAATTGREVGDSVDASTGMRTIEAETPHARDFAFAIGHLRRTEAVVDGTRIRIFAARSSSPASSRHMLGAAGDALRAYTRWFGSYGSPELDVVQSSLAYNGVEFPELVFADAYRATVVHEVAHQWWYGIVGDDQYGEPWLDEPLAAWSETQLAPGSYPCDPRHPLGTRTAGLLRGMGYYDRHPDAYDDVIYRGGSCALTSLENMLGRARFLGMLRREVSRYRYGVVRTADLLALVRETDPLVAARWERLVGLPRG